MTLDLITFTSIAGVPASPSPRKCGRAFFATLERAFEDLWARCPWGRASRIVHMGAYVDRPDPQGTDRHAQGRAIDIHEIEWPGPVIVSARDGSAALSDNRRLPRYLAVTAVLEMHIGCVLNYWQPDGKHRSHWHLDDHREPGWSPQWKPSVRFLQAALNYVWDAEPALKVDGDFGPKTESALIAALDKAGFSGESRTEGFAPMWPAFLEETAQRGFAR